MSTVYLNKVSPGISNALSSWYPHADPHLKNLSNDEKEAIAKTVYFWGRGGTWASFRDTIAYIFSCICFCGCITSSWDRAVNIVASNNEALDPKEVKIILNGLIATEKMANTKAPKGRYPEAVCCQE